MKKAILFFQLSTFYFLISTFHFQLSAQVHLSPYDLVNSDLRYLQISGTLSGLDLNQLPALSDQLIKTLRRDLSKTSLTGTQRSLLLQVRQSYTYGDTTETSGLLNRLIEKVLVNQVMEAQFYVGGRFDLSTVSDPGKVYPELRSFAAAILPYGISVVNVMAINPYATEDPNYLGKEWRGISGYTEQAYMLWQTKFSRVTLGRSYMVNGPGRGANLLFSSAARPMDQIRFEFFNKNFNFQSMAAQLDPINGADRYLNSHRLTLYLQRWQFSVTEAVLYGGVRQRLEFAYLNPFIFYHGEQMNGPGLAGNTLGTVELSYTGERWYAYTEILIDDIQLDNELVGDLEPNELGLVAGFDLADPLNIEGLYLGLEYTALTNRTYKTTNPIEWHTHRNVPIGYSQGSDLDCWDLEIKKYLNRWQAILNVRYLRQGEGEMNVACNSPWMDSTVTMESGYDEPFPTGVVEKTLDLGLELRWLPSYQRYGFLRLNYQTIQNVNHTPYDQQNLILTLGIHWDFRFRF
ncbi:MAG: capsule assembly Wzi family protein [Candidatus Marinimicrobia bacterium]|nr:capsule assembly Wzi family protein [Candidatus Neomarinimicrobiota bacterium]